MENDTSRVVYGTNSTDGCCIDGCCGSDLQSQPAPSFTFEGGPVDQIVIESGPAVQSYNFTHFKRFMHIADQESERTYIFSPSKDERPLLLTVKGAEWLRIGKNGHVLVLGDGTVSFIPYGWIAMTYEPAVEGDVYYTK